MPIKIGVETTSKGKKKRVEIALPTFIVVVFILLFLWTIYKSLWEVCILPKEVLSPKWLRLGIR